MRNTEQITETKKTLDGRCVRRGRNTGDGCSDVRETAEYLEQMEVGLTVLRDYPISLAKLAE